jgi:hypothetical protein
MTVRMVDSFSKLSMPNVSTDPFSDLRWFDHLSHSTDVAQGGLRLYTAQNSSERASREIILPMTACASSIVGAGIRSLVSLNNFYTPLFSPVGNPDQQEEARFVDQTIAAIRAESPAWDALVFQPLDPASSFFASLKTAFRNHAYLSGEFFCFGNWYLPVEGRSFESYFHGLRSVLRHTIERAQRKLANAHAARIELIQSADENLEKAIADFVSVYQRSWKRPEPYPEFIPGLCRVAAQAGWLRLGILYADEQPVAAQIWLNSPAKAAIYKLAYDERYTKLSVGSVLTAEMFRHALDVDKVQEIDYLVGDDPYKRDWMSHRRERRGLIAFNPRSARGLLAAGKHYLGALVGRLRASG